MTCRAPGANAASSACNARHTASKAAHGKSRGSADCASGGTSALAGTPRVRTRSEEHTSELQSRQYLVCRLLLDAATSENYALALHDALPALGLDVVPALGREDVPGPRPQGRQLGLHRPPHGIEGGPWEVPGQRRLRLGRHLGARRDAAGED